MANYGYELNEDSDRRDAWDESDAILITYGDVIRDQNRPEAPRLRLLSQFLEQYLNHVISTVHILPFFPSSSDAGFSVIDYKGVRDDLGSWDEISALSKEYKLMADLVINHASRYSQWFKNFKQGKSPGKDYFIEVKPEEDLSSVTRPRSSPLVTTVETDHGLSHVWTTFSDDQVDLDFTNPEVLFEFIDIFLFYYSHGIQVIRLDAIAYLWKRIGTKSIHLEETHQVVKLFREIVECVDKNITLITETNVPFEENISYFGEQDEAHMIYQFSLPPLLLHAILTENARYLTRWALELPDLPEHCTYFNFTASHDGIGVRPLEGLVPDDDFDYLIQSTKERGGFVSYKKNPDGGQSPYELNITYFDAFEDPGNPRSDLQKKRYMCSQLIMLSLKGVPGIYFHNLMASKNDLDEVLVTGKKRDINRRHFDWDDLINLIEDPDRINHRIFEEYKQVLRIRKGHAAFHPEAQQDVLDLDDRLFAFVRTAPEGDEQILVISNVSNGEVRLEDDEMKIEIPGEGLEDVLTGDRLIEGDELRLKPYQTVWLRGKALRNLA